MRERPILFSAPMVRALLASTKTQTRRVVKVPHNNPLGKWEPTTFGGPNGGLTRKGETIPEHVAIWRTRTGETIGAKWVVGDRLWVRETCRAHEITDAEADADTWKLGDRLDEFPAYGLDGVVYTADNAFREIENTLEASERWGALNAYRGKRGAVVPGIHMPRWASRITLEITEVRVERLQDISFEDALAEGVADYRPLIEPECNDGETADQCARRLQWPQREYRLLWESINGNGSWERNDWVWVVGFKRVTP